MKRLIVTEMQWKGYPCRVMAQEENGRLCALHLEKPGQKNLLGSIHLGKVQKVLPNIQGAFVEIEDHLPCYLPMNSRSDTSVPLRAGDELLVQVTQEALKLKAPCLSSELSFTGNFLVLTTGNKKIGVSGKIPENRRKELKNFIENLLPPDRTYGVVVRTNAVNAAQEQLEKELDDLQGELKDVLHRGSYCRPFTCLRQGESGLLVKLKGLYWDEMEKIVTDLPQIFEEIQSYVRQVGKERECPVILYEDQLLPLYKLYCLEHGIEEAMQEKVWLRSGGFLVIQQTEAFVSVDVNSGKHNSKKNPEEFYRKMNAEAAEEIARQIRLRNLYGIILIDFINMKSEQDRAELLRRMREAVKRDRIKTTVVDVTALGIMELTRQKGEKSLKEQFQEIVVTTGGR